MKNKDERIKELEESKLMWKMFTVIFIFGFIAFFMTSVYRFDVIQNLEEQLQSCQEKVLVWTLEYKCIKSESTIISVQRNFSNYENYNDNKIYFDRQKNCEVIK